MTHLPWKADVTMRGTLHLIECKKDCFNCNMGEVAEIVYESTPLTRFDINNDLWSVEKVA
jgi:hypothetical protein